MTKENKILEENYPEGIAEIGYRSVESDAT